MSNEELVAAIQAGENRMGELWDQVEGLVKWKANRIMTALALKGNPCGVEFVDLYQSGYIALVAAVDTYTPEGGAFSTWLGFYLQNEFARITGYRTQKEQREPLNNALSLDSPLTDDSDAATFGDLIPDKRAAATMQDIEEKLWQEQLHEAVEMALAELPEQSAEIMRLRYYQGLTAAEAGELSGVGRDGVRRIESKAIRQLRRPEMASHLRPFYDYDFYCGTGLGTFRNTGTSVQDRYLIAQEERRERAGRRNNQR